ncbi:hypothetical protein L914_05830 [Phytophthora nicotianae]|uniref:Uncharacterized protein n=1 Tax=Phytophthora nicotianae TaxID=4792 RepID=W2NQ40_PHYNI|nr:hypothetical protein L914_05830 [Phytophthora nicotianae]
MDRPSRQVRLLSLRSHHRQSTNGQTICIGRVIVTDGIAFCTNANASPSDPHRACTRLHKRQSKTCAWTDINDKSEINFVLECEKDSYFLESNYAGSIFHDTVSVAADVERVL